MEELTNVKTPKTIDNRIEEVQQGRNLDVYLTDPSWQVRKAVAERGYGLDRLMKDENYLVRKAVARQGFGGERLIYDEAPSVRNAVLETCYQDLPPHALILNKYQNVRLFAAQHGIGLDSLIHDSSHIVRGAVAKRGYCLEHLIHDPSKYVRDIAMKEIRNIDPAHLCENQHVDVRVFAAKQGLHSARLAKDKDPSVRRAVASTGRCLAELLNDEDWTVRREVAWQGYGLETLVSDEHHLVRKAIATQGYGLDVLLDDPNESVYDAAARAFHHLVAPKDPHALTVEELYLPKHIEDVLLTLGVKATEDITHFTSTQLKEQTGLSWDAVENVGRRLHAFSLFFSTYSFLDRLVQKIERPSYERTPDNRNRDTFDHIRVTVNLASANLFRDWNSFRDTVKRFLPEINKEVMARIRDDRSFQKFGVPVNVLWATSINLGRDHTLEYVFEIKKHALDAVVTNAQKRVEKDAAKKPNSLEHDGR